MSERVRYAIALCLAAALLGVPSRASAQKRQEQRRAERWVIPPNAPCEGLTIGWAIPTGELRQLLGPGLEPAPGPAPGTGLLLLFVAKCPGSTIDDRSTGPFVSAHVIVPIAPPSIAGAPAARGVKGWIAIPETYGEAEGRVRALFQRRGFAVRTGDASLHITAGAAGTHARLVLATPGGRLTASATLGDSTRRFESMTGIVGGTAAQPALAHGPEHSLRRTGGTAVVTAEGATPIAGLHPIGKPVAVLDTNFSWSFTFEGNAEGGDTGR